MAGESFALVLLAGAKWITYLGLMVLTGAVAVSRLLAPAAGAAGSGRGPVGLGDGVAPRGRVEAGAAGSGRGPVGLGDGVAPRGRVEAGAAGSGRGPVDRRLHRVAAAGAVLLVAGAAARLCAQTWSVFGPDEPVTLELLRVVGIDSRWGAGWRPQAGAAVLAAAAVAWWKRQPRPGWWLAALAAAGAWITLPLTGHAASFPTVAPHVVQVAHGLGAGLWIGALAALVAVASRLGRERGHESVADGVRSFSALAQGSVATVALSGIVTAVLYVGSWDDLWTTAWGRHLLLKTALFLTVGAVGACNWRRLTPRLGDAAGTRALLMSARLELLLAAAVLLVTAFLVHLAMPGEMM